MVKISKINDKVILKLKRKSSKKGGIGSISIASTTNNSSGVASIEVFAAVLMIILLPFINDAHRLLKCWYFFGTFILGVLGQ